MNEKKPFEYNNENKFFNKFKEGNGDVQFVASSEFVKKKIAEQAREKGWSVDPVWLMFSWAKEVFEVIQTFEHADKCEVWFNEKQRTTLIKGLDMLAGIVIEPEDAEIYRKVADMLRGKSTDLATNLAKEYGDTEYFKAQTMTALAPSVNLDAAVKCVYDNNEVNAKKTYLEGKIQEK